MILIARCFCLWLILLGSASESYSTQPLRSIAAIKTRLGCRGHCILASHTPCYTPSAEEHVAALKQEVPSELASWEVCLCGAFATALGDLVVHPIDTVKTAQQTSTAALGLLATTSNIIRLHGVRGLYSGLLPCLVANGLSGAIKFATFEAGKSYVEKQLPEKLRTVGSFVCAGGAMLASSVVLVPGEVVKTRLQTSVVSMSVRQIIVDILRREGVKGLFAGYYATLARELPYTVLELGLYENLKTLISRLKKTSPSDDMLAAAITGGVTALVTTPLDLIKTTLMAGEQRHAGVADALVSFYHAGGLRSLFVGATSRVFWLLPFTTIYLRVYELAKRKMRARHTHSVKTKESTR